MVGGRVLAGIVLFVLVAGFFVMGVEASACSAPGFLDKMKFKFKWVVVEDATRDDMLYDWSEERKDEVVCFAEYGSADEIGASLDTFLKATAAADVYGVAEASSFVGELEPELQNVYSEADAERKTVLVEAIGDRVTLDESAGSVDSTAGVSKLAMTYAAAKTATKDAAVVKAAATKASANKTKKGLFSGWFGSANATKDGEGGLEDDGVAAIGPAENLSGSERESTGVGDKPSGGGATPQAPSGGGITSPSGGSSTPAKGGSTTLPSSSGGTTSSGGESTTLPSDVSTTPPSYGGGATLTPYSGGSNTLRIRKSCLDSDGGWVMGTYGTVTYTSDVGGSYSEYDYCVSGSRVMEWYCSSNNEPMSTEIACAADEECAGGACVRRLATSTTHMAYTYYCEYVSWPESVRRTGDSAVYECGNLGGVWRPYCNYNAANNNMVACCSVTPRDSLSNSFEDCYILAGGTVGTVFSGGYDGTTGAAIVESKNPLVKIMDWVESLMFVDYFLNG